MISAGAALYWLFGVAFIAWFWLIGHVPVLFFASNGSAWKTYYKFWGGTLKLFVVIGFFLTLFTLDIK